MTQWDQAPNGEQPAQPDRGRGREVRLVVTGVAVVLLAWFAFANLQAVRIRFWLTTAHAPLILVIVISGVLGALVPGVWSRVARRRRPPGRS